MLWALGCELLRSGMVGGALLAAARCRWLALACMGGGAAGGWRSAADRGSGAGARAARSSRRPHRAGAACRLPAPRPSAARTGAKPGQKEKDQSGRRGVCAACSGLSASPGAGPGWLLLGAAGGRFRRRGTAGSSTVPASTVFPPGDAPKCRRAKGSDSTLYGISPHR